MKSSGQWLTIGEVAARTGAATSALRFYESIGLIASTRTEGNQRRYPRSSIRIVSIILAAQGLGLSLEQVKQALATLPESRVPTAEDWARLSTTWRADLDRRIAFLQKLRDNLDSCIGCGCLSLETCGLFNRDDQAGAQGTGARYLMSGDAPTGAGQE